MPLVLSAANRGLLENSTVDELLGNTENPTLDFGLFFAPTAANVSVSGTVETQNGRGVSKARVRLSAANGNFSKEITTNSFGKFTIEDIPVGDAYIISIRHKQYTFNPQVLSLNEPMDDLIFRANE